MTSISTAGSHINVETGSDLKSSVKDKGKGKEERQIPTYEDATGVFESSRLPLYRARSARYSPYGRPRITSSNDFYDGPHPADRFFNTIYDDECVFLEVPPAVAPRASTPHPLYAGSSVQEGPSNWNHHQDFEHVFQQFLHGHQAASTSRAHAIAQLNREHEVDAQDLAYALEDAVAYNVHMQNLAEAILTEFVAGLARARVE